MIPTQSYPVNEREFPRLNGRNVVIWKARVIAALDGKNLIDVVTQADYAGDSDVDLGPDEKINPAYSEQLGASLTGLGVPKPDSQEDSSTKKRKAKNQQLSSKKLRLMEVKAKAFLIKPFDDQHVLMVKEKTAAYEIYQTLCNKYEGAAVHGDPSYIPSYLMALKNEEGSDIATLKYDLESAMTAAADSTNSVLSDEHTLFYLCHSLPTDWKSELAVWKGSRKYIPYEDLKRNIETKVHNEFARNRYVLKQGTPESWETRAKKAMQALVPEQVLVEAPSNTDMVVVSSRKCTYCQYDNHDTVDCYILQRHLYNSQIKAGTVQPANFKLKPPQ
ncbi:Hypothetical protein PHPALM_65 [Phytophthora palmivora]|uniref:Uncharacterized protein n=1 Tax=Phytophthora palmivora TaxID=4796 RepID=A0A2P4YVY0_9STRA|nr:Hypothetical protein PHPALM_65 [Phytophthora palmivora]